MTFDPNDPDGAGRKLNPGDRALLGTLSDCQRLTDKREPEPTTHDEHGRLYVLPRCSRECPHYGDEDHPAELDSGPRCMLTGRYLDDGSSELCAPVLARDRAEAATTIHRLELALASSTVASAAGIAGAEVLQRAKDAIESDEQDDDES